MEHSYQDVLTCGSLLALNEETPSCPEAEAALRCLMKP